MATGIEDSVVVFLLDAIEAQRLVELSVGLGVLFEPPGDVRLEVRLVALGIERRAAALRRCEGDLGAGILENVVGRGEFLQPEAGFATRVAELVVRSQNHQDFHKALFPWSSVKWSAQVSGRKVDRSRKAHPSGTPALRMSSMIRSRPFKKTGLSLWAPSR